MSALSKTLSVVGVIAGLVLLSPILTGSAIANLNSTNSTIIGSILLIAGIVGLFISVKN